MKQIISISCLIFFLFSSCRNGNSPGTTPAAKDSVVFSEHDSLELAKNDSIIKPVKGADSVLLRFNLQKGKKYGFNMNFDVSQSSAEHSGGSNTNWTYTAEVINEKNEIRTVRLTYRQITMNMDMGLGGQRMEFSSEKEVQPGDLFQMPSRVFRALKGKSFTMQVNKNGEIINIDGVDRIAGEVVNIIDTTGQNRQAMLQRAKALFSDRSVRQMFALGFDVFPGRFVKIGDSWERNSFSIGPLQNETVVYQVSEIRGERVTLRVRSKQKGSLNGKMVINARNGLVLNAVFSEKKQTQKNINVKAKIIGKES